MSKEIIVKQDSSAGSIDFVNTTIQSFLNTLHAERSKLNPENINIINTKKSSGTRRVYEMRNTSYLNFTDKDGNKFSSSTEAVDYINQTARTFLTDATILNDQDSIDFSTDVSNTIIFASNGSTYPVGTLSAHDAGDGTMTVSKNDTSGTVTFVGLLPDRTTISGSPVSTQLSDAVNELNAMFNGSSIGALVGAGSITVVSGGVPTTLNIDSYSEDPVGDDVWRSESVDCHRGRAWTTNTIVYPGEYFTVDLSNAAVIGFGLYDTTSTTIATTYTEQGDRNTGYFWSLWMDDALNSAEDVYGSDPGHIRETGWVGGTLEEIFNTSTVEANAWATGSAPVRFRIGVSVSGFVTSFYYNSTLGRYVPLARSTTQVDENRAYGLMIKSCGTVGTITGTPILFSRRDDILLRYFYYENHDGTFMYPLFKTDEESDYVDQFVNEGDGTSHAHWFPDDPQMHVWYMPNNGATMNSVTAPVSTVDIVYTKIQTSTPTSFAPEPFTMDDVSFTENTPINVEVSPYNAGYQTIMHGLPTSLTVSGNRLIGTTPFVSSNTVYSVQVTRVNTFGSQQAGFYFTILDNASMSSITGWTVHQGNVFQPNMVLPSENAVMEYNTPLAKGRQVRWMHRSEGTIGILAAGVTLSNKEHDDILSSSTNWDIRMSLYNDGINIGLPGVGWVANTNINFNNDISELNEWTLEYVNGGGDDGKFKLYLDGILKLTSTGVFVPSQTLAFVTSSNEVRSLVVPGFVEEASVFSGDAISGFTHVATSPALIDGSTLDENSSVTIDTTIDTGKRYIIPETWIEQHVLPFLIGAGDSVTIGVSASGADASDGLVDAEFDMAIKWEYRNTNSHRNTMFAASGAGTLSGGNLDANTNESIVQSVTEAFFDYAFEVHDGNVHMIGSDTEALNIAPGVDSGGSFARVFSVASYSGTIPITLTLTTTSSTSTFSLADLQNIDIPDPQYYVGVTENPEGTFLFDGNTTFPTLNAGHTYRFVVSDASLEATDHVRFTNDELTEYTSGVTRSGTPGTSGSYVEWTVPIDVVVPMFFYQNADPSTNGPVPIYGSTYQPPAISGYTHVPTSTALLDSVTLDSGSVVTVDDGFERSQRVIFDRIYLNFLMTDFTSWQSADKAIVGVLFSGASAPYTQEDFNYGINITKSGGTGHAISGFYNVSTSQTGTNTIGYVDNLTSTADHDFAFEISGDGSRVNLLMSSDSTSHSVTSSPVGDFGVDSYELVLSTPVSTEVDWSIAFVGAYTQGVTYTDTVPTTGISTIVAPVPNTTTTPFTKHIVHSGSIAKLQSTQSKSPLWWSNPSQNSVTAGMTASNGSPCAFGAVFYHDNQVSNPTDRYLVHSGPLNVRNSASTSFVLTCGSSTFNMLKWTISESFIPQGWVGIYVDYNGGTTGASSGDLALYYSRYRVKLVDMTSGVVTDITPHGTWSHTNYGFTSVTITQKLGTGVHIAMRKIASYVATTLRNNDTLPTDVEVSAMIRDPLKWLQDYKIGNTYRKFNNTSLRSNFQIGDAHSMQATSVNLMGDGTNEGYPLLTNQVNPSGSHGIELINYPPGAIQTILPPI